MTQTTVPEEVRRFVLADIPSVPLLEALLLRSEPARSWDSFNVASRLYIGENQAQELLLGMQQSGLARRSEDGGFAFSPRTRELAGVIDALAATYAHNLVAITDLVHSRRALCKDMS